MRTLQNIRSDRATLAHTSSAGGAAAVAAAPFPLLIVMAWMFAPRDGALIVTGVLGGLLMLLIRNALPRKVDLHLPPGGVLTWEDGLDDSDTYRVWLRTGKSDEVLLLEHEDPAKVLRDLRRVSDVTGLAFEGPDWTRAGAQQLLAGSRVVLVSGCEEGTHWIAQRQAAWAVVGGGAFVCLLFVGSVRSEAELTWFSVVLPLFSVALSLCIAALLFSLRVRVTTTPERVDIDRVVFGFSRRVLALPRQELLSARAVGHPGYSSRHLLFETIHGPLAISLAGEPARLAAERVRVELGLDGLSQASGRGRVSPGSQNVSSHASVRDVRA